ncbi:glycosyltransferase family 10 domain-containing protein [Roseobacter sp. HKCC-CH-9208]|uniref:glycosyltransferase family 10 domain-containing protein n=1 Tax=Roseobacter sp. HKCC-CH-9208 TaxID=3120339 RepID=UPI0030ECDC1E
MNDEIKTVLINYDFASSSKASREEISGTDKRNLWCGILRDNLSSRGCRLIFPGDIRGLPELKIDMEIHVNAGKRRTSAPYSVGLFMETPEIAPLNNASSCKLYDKVISFNPALQAIENHVLAELPCWDANDLTQAVENDRDCGSNTFSMIAANKNFKNPVKYKDLYKERARIIQYFETSNTEEFKLYGSAWDIRHELLAFPKLQKIARKLKIRGNLKSYGGICVSKNDVIRSSTFNICFENCIYPGYLSEKVFDAILGGSIPIYWGHHGIPQSLKTAVIDASQFQSSKDIVQHCGSLDIEERLKIIRNGKKFLQSDGLKYSHQIYANQITRHIETLLLAK